MTTSTRTMDQSGQITIDDRSIEHHYVPSAQILDSLVNGVLATALCGDRFVVTADPVTAGRGGSANVCGKCTRIYASLAEVPA